MNTAPNDHGFSEQHLEEAAQIATRLAAWLAAEQDGGQRQRVRGVCIDGRESLDRDDAIWFTVNDKGQLEVDITIADLGATLPKGSELDMEARERATSTYHQSSVKEPMLPFLLSQDDGAGHGLLSLSDKGDRPAMTTRITLDVKTGVLVSVALIPSVIRAEIADYETVHARANEGEATTVIPATRAAMEAINNSPLRYRVWGQIAKLLRDARREGRDGFVPVFREENGNITEATEEGELLRFPKEELDARRIVEESALLANRANARLARRCELPFPYRIHSVHIEGDPLGNRKFYRLSDAAEAQNALRQMGESTEEGRLKIELDWAEYSHSPLPHIGLGFSAYAHTTSPIRRYPDVVAQRMEHWLVKANHALAAVLARGDVSRETVLARLWQGQTMYDKAMRAKTLRGDRLAKGLYNLRAATHPNVREKAREFFEEYLIAAYHILYGKVSLPEVAKVIAQLEDDPALAVPYQRDEMVALTKELTQTLHRQRESEEIAANAALAFGLQEQLSRMDREVLALLQAGDAKAMRELSQPRFTALMNRAAQLTMVQVIPADLVRERFRLRELKEPDDLAIIFAELPLPDATNFPKENEEWKALKEEILTKRFVDNPASAKGFFQLLKLRYGWTLHTSNTTLIDAHEAGKGPVAAVVSLLRYPGAKREVPPVFSIGYWGKSTRHHARIEFLRALGQGKLQQDEPRLPMALELMIYDPQHLQRYGELNEMIFQVARENGIELAAAWDPVAFRYTIEASSAEGRGNIPKLSFSAVQSSEQAARHEVMQQLMLHSLMRPVQAELFARFEKLEKVPLNADEGVDEIIARVQASRGEGAVNLERQKTMRLKNRDEDAREIWSASAQLTIGQGLRRDFSAQSTQKDVAETLLNEAILQHLIERGLVEMQFAGRDTMRSGSFSRAIRDYEQDIARSYIDDVPEGRVEFANRVPYTAHILPMEHYRLITPAEEVRP